MLPISHDEVVHMKGAPWWGRCPATTKISSGALRGFYAYLLAHPGKKLLFMGAELGQWHEWDSDGQLDWYLLDQELNQKVHRFFKEINAFYKKEPALWEIDFSWEGFEWLVPDDNHNNVVVFLRKDKKGRDLMCAVNFSPNTYENYRMGVPPHRRYVPVFNTDDPPTAATASAIRGRWQWRPSLPWKRILRGDPDPAFGAVFLRGEGRSPSPGRKNR